VALTQITDHQAIACSRLVEQYRESVTVNALVALATAENQALENTLWADYGITLPTAVGEQLDLLGSLVGQAREGMDDATYRLWIAARVLLNRSSGTGPQILAIMRCVVPSSATLTLIPYYPKAFTLKVGGAAVDAGILSELLSAATEATTNGYLETLATPGAQAFSFAGGGGLGFDEGTWASVVTV